MKDFTPIKGFDPGYFINKDGVVISLKKNHNKNPYIMKYRVDIYGYRTITLRKNGKPVHTTVHRLLAMTFIPNPENHPQINHINGDKLDNRLENLEWCSTQYNIQHAYDNNLSNMKEICHNNLRKFNDINEYVYIRLEKDGYTRVFLNTLDAARFVGCARSTIQSALCKKVNKVGGWILTAYKRANEEAFIVPKATQKGNLVGSLEQLVFPFAKKPVSTIPRKGSRVGVCHPFEKVVATYRMYGICG